MKKIFCLIGIIIGIFNAFFIMLMAAQTPFLESKDQYTYDCDTPISTTQLTTIAKKADVEIQIKNYVESGVFNRKINITLLNPNKNSKFGVQPNLIPGNVLTCLDGQNLKQEISLFRIEENDIKKIDLFNQELSKYNIKYDISTTKYMHLVEKLILSPMAYIILGLLFIVIVFCITSYFISRSNEIAILKLNGWNNLKISLRLINQISTVTLLSAVIIMSMFSVYIFIMDSSHLLMYLELCLFLLSIVYLIFILASLIAIFFIEKMDKTIAMKKGKNNKAILYLFIISKIILTVVFFCGFNSSINQYIDCMDTLESGKVINERGLYRIRVSQWPTSKLEEKINHYLSTIPNEEIFNYIPLGDSTFNKRQIKNGEAELTKAKQFVNINREPNLLIMSNNTLNYFDIISSTGEKINLKNQSCVLIPNHLKKHETKLLTYLFDDTSAEKSKPEVHYIKDAQIMDSLIYPNTLHYDSIIEINPTEKRLENDFFFTESTAKKIENEFNRLGIDPSEIKISKISDESNSCIEADLVQSYSLLFVLVLSLLSYLLSAIAVFTVNFEIKKKAFGVYALLGKKPYKLCINVLLINTIIISAIVFFINKLFLLWIAVEVLLFIIWNIRYMKKKAILEIKGE